MLVDKSRLKKFYDDVAEIESGLRGQFPLGYLHITSIETDKLLEHRPGIVFLALPRVAALAIAKKTHRVATSEEIEKHDRELAERTAHCEAQERVFRGQKGQVVISNRMRSEIEGK